jgi:hypothetical protein
MLKINPQYSFSSLNYKRLFVAILLNKECNKYVRKNQYSVNTSYRLLNSTKLLDINNKTKNIIVNKCWDICKTPYKYIIYREDIREVRYEYSIYPLKKSIKISFIDSHDSNLPYQCIIKDFSQIYGKGSNINEAIKNWKQMFHQTFQELSAKLDWERTEEEQQLWETFERVVDIPAHYKKTPVNYRQTGKIIENKNIPKHKREIAWLDGSVDIVDCDKCPFELLRYAVGEYFRADLLREHQTGKLVKIRAISSSTYRDYTDKEVEDFVNSLQSSQNLPDSTTWK